MTSPTQRSLKKMRDAGWHCEVVEHYSSYGNVRKDLFGFIDILCVRGEETIGIQTTTFGNRLARIKKIKPLLGFKKAKLANWLIVVHGWIKRGNRWEVIEEFL